jgi:methionine synthase I (cobalamin-dependent)
MATKSLRNRIGEGVLLLDGAMGTQLMARGVAAGTCFDSLNETDPDTVISVHRSYIEAGSDAVLTNTFGANRIALARHGLADRVARINAAGADIARAAAGPGVYVLGDIGPCGDFLEPVGAVKAGDLAEAFEVQAASLGKRGIDAILVESFTALEEAAIAVEAVKSVTGLPVFVSMAFDGAAKGFRTMMGVDVDSAVERLIALGVDAVGFNCGRATLEDYVELAGRYVREVTSLASGTAVLAEPNAGLPVMEEGRLVYRVGPDDFAGAVGKIRSAGVSIIGGCCGTGPEHIAAVRRLLG